MALLTDGPVAEIADLQAYDSSILDTARNEGIGLDKKIEVAQRKLELELSVFLLRMGGEGLMSLNGQAELRKVVVTAGLERWHVLETLAAVYCDAYNSQLNDRYLGRWKEYARLAEQTAEMVREVGVGVVRDPLPRPSAPVVTASGAPGADITYAIQFAWRSASGASSAASPVAHYSVLDGAQPVVSVADAPANASGWDVYVSIAGDPPLKQNLGAIPVGSSWTMPGTGLVAGLPAASGQTPDYYVRRSRVLPRG